MDFHLFFVYGISENVNISASRSSNQKIYELGSKIRLVKQRKGENPFNIVVYSSVLANTGLDKDNLPKLDFKHRLSYVAQLLVSRKINSKLSFILAPTFFQIKTGLWLLVLGKISKRQGKKEGK